MGAASLAANMAPLRRLVADRAGLALDVRRDDALAEAVEAVRERLGLADADAVIAACARAPGPDAALDLLLESLRAGETHFFRTRAEFDALERVALPEVLARRVPGRRPCVWSAGCSTGEEAFSLGFAVERTAMALGDPGVARELLVLATDASAQALAAARAGEFGAYSFRGVTTAERARFFEDAGDKWRVREPWRSRILFERHDLVRDAVPAAATGADVIVCCNVLMHLTPDAVRIVLERLVDALAVGGWLLVGAAEHGLVRGLPLEVHALPNVILYRRVPGAARSATDGSREDGSPRAPSLPLPPAPRGPPADPLAAAHAALLAGDRNMAATLAVDAVESGHGGAPACAFLGALAADRGHAREAEAWLLRALELDADHPDAAYLLALIAEQQGDGGKAASLATRALASRPDFVMALQLLARMRFGAGDVAGAEAALRRALDALARLPPDAAVPQAHDLRARHVASALESLASSWASSRRRRRP